MEVERIKQPETSQSKPSNIGRPRKDDNMEMEKQNRKEDKQLLKEQKMKSQKLLKKKKGNGG